MKKILATLAGLGVLTLACQADLLIYNIKSTGTTIGSGAAQKNSTGGAFVIDPNNILLAEIGVQTSAKEFRIFQYDTGTIVSATANGKTYTALTYSPGSPGVAIGSTFATGLNASLITGTITNYSYPKVFTATTSVILLGTPNSFQQDKGTLTFNVALTTQQNGLDGNFNNALNRIAQDLINSGYTQLPTVTD